MSSPARLAASQSHAAAHDRTPKQFLGAVLGFAGLVLFASFAARSSARKCARWRRATGRSSAVLTPQERTNLVQAARSSMQDETRAPRSRPSQINVQEKYQEDIVIRVWNAGSRR